MLVRVCDVNARPAVVIEAVRQCGSVKDDLWVLRLLCVIKFRVLCF